MQAKLLSIEESNKQRRRAKRLSIDWQELLFIISGKKELAGLPDDCQIIAVQNNFCAMCFDLIIHSESFEETPLGMDYPRISREIFPLQVIEVPKDQFGFTHMAVKEGTEVLIEQKIKEAVEESCNIKFREFI